MDVTKNADSELAMVRRSLEDVASGDEVLTYIQRLTSERDELLKRQEHLTSLARLMEKTVADADEMAAQIKSEAESEAQSRGKELVAQAEREAQSRAQELTAQAESEAQSRGQELIAQAEEKAKMVLEEARSKAAADTESEVRAIRENAVKELEGALGEQVARWQEQARQAAQRLYDQMVAQAEQTRRVLEALQPDLAQVVASVRSGAGQTAAPPADTPAAAEETPAAKSVFAPPAEAAKHGKADEELVDIVILPPRDKQAMDSIRKFLERQEEVAAVNVEHMTDRTLIQVLLAAPLNVAERLSGLSEVERLQTVSDGSRTKIQVVLSVQSEIERERDRLDVRANRIASKIGRLSE
jgi:vacuolar-type H+-ATPase subunit H